MNASKPPHPGRLQIFDGRTQEMVDDLDASQLSDGLRYAKTAKGWEAVTRIVEVAEGARLSWSAFNADGDLLRRGSARRG